MGLEAHRSIAVLAYNVALSFKILTGNSIPNIQYYHVHESIEMDCAWERG